MRRVAPILKGGTHPWPDDLTVVDSLPNGDEFIAIEALAEWLKIDAVRVVVNPD